MREIIRYALSAGSNMYSAVYQTPETRELDLLLGLKNKPISEEAVWEMYHKINPFLEESSFLCYAIGFAGGYGNVVGFPFSEIEKISRGRITSYELNKGIENRSISKIEGKEIEIVFPIKGPWLRQ